MPTRSTWTSPGASRRYDKGETEDERTAYLNCPMTKADYEAFIDALLAADKTEFHEGETRRRLLRRLPAHRGDGRTRPRDPALRTDEAGRADQRRTGRRRKPYAVVQLRRDNALGTLYNIVGFQTKMKYGAQTEVLQDDSGPWRGAASRGSAASTATPS